MDLSGRNRLNAELPARALNFDDVIEFSKLPDLDVKVKVRVTGLLKYISFVDLVNDFPMSFFGHPQSYDLREFVEGIYKIYTKEEEQKYGVLGIRIKLI